MTNQEKKEYLQKAYNLNKEIKSNREEIDNLESVKAALKGVDYSKEKVQSSRSSYDPQYTRIVEKIHELENDIKDELESMLETSRSARKKIVALKNKDERLVCKYRYIMFLTWEEIAHKMHITVRHVHRIHGRALQNIKIT